MRMRYVIGMVLVAALAGCRSLRKPPPPSGTTAELAAAYIRQYAPLAVKEMRRSGVPASITLAQGILESDYGRSKLAVKGNNHFGIKCKTDWQGRKIYIDDDRPNECFRRYSSVEESYRDHSDFLRNNPRYRFLFLLDPTDYKGWAYGLKKAGYATNPKYAQLLIRLIEQYQLDRFDEVALRRAPMPDLDARPASPADKPPVVSADPTPPPEGWAIRSGHPLPPGVFLHNGIPATRTKAGDTKWKIAVKYQLKPAQLLKYNDLPSSVDSFRPGLILYLKPKKKKGPKPHHIVNSGETLHWISQMYGMKLSALRKYNKIPEGMEPLPGQRLCLQGPCNPPPRWFDPSHRPATASTTPPASPPRMPHPEKASSPSTNAQATKRPPADTLHIVSPGETLYQIAVKYQTTVQALMELNQLSSAIIHPGDTLRVRPLSLLEDVKEAAPSDEGATYYEVKPGDTLYRIARTLNMSVADLRKLNPDVDPAALKPGMKLRIR